MSRYTIHTGDCRASLESLPERSVQTCVTSPPYYGLRDYGHEGQIGLEETPEAYVAKMVEVFREVRRVLRDDGTLWLNIGDSYAARYRQAGPEHAGALTRSSKGVLTSIVRDRPIGYKEKDLIGIPWMLAFALRADGWYLRQDIIWHKPNPMPESVTDRCTKAHEYVFLFSKSARYFYDAEAVKEPSTMHSVDWNPDGTQKRKSHPRGYFGGKNTDRGKEAFRKIAPTRNRRSVWSITTRPFKHAHFAVMPEALVEPCVLAGTSEKGCCAACGSPRKRVTGRPCPKCATLIPTQGKECAACGHRNTEWRDERGSNASTRAGESDTVGPLVARKTDLTAKSVSAGWEPSCGCEAETAACLVLDPFTGSGTVAVVSLREGRNFVGCELNPDYVTIAETRIAEAGCKHAAPKESDKPLTGAPAVCNEQLPLFNAE